MKKVFSLLALALVSSAAIAAEDTSHPCHKIRAACEAAGFKKGAHSEGKGLIKDCMANLKKGEAVEGVAVTPEEVTACSAKVADRKKKREKRQEVRVETGTKMTPGKMNNGK